MKNVKKHFCLIIFSYNFLGLYQKCILHEYTEGKSEKKIEYNT